MHTNFVLFAYFNLFYVGTMKFSSIIYDCLECIDRSSK
jgi:hypothetical protein